MKTHDSANIPQRSSSDRQKLTRSGLSLILVLVAILFWVMIQPDPVSVPESKAKKYPSPESFDAVVQSEAEMLSPNFEKIKTQLDPLIDAYPKLVAQPMKLTKKVLVSKKWNDGQDSFGLNKPPDEQEGDTIGPSSVTYAKEIIYVLDNVHNRILSYDRNGKPLAIANLPSGGLAMDLVVDPRDDSLFVIDSYQDKIHKVKGSEVATIDPVPLRMSLVIGARYAYDVATDTLWAQDMENGGDIGVPVLQNGKVVEVEARTAQIYAPTVVKHEGEYMIVAMKDGTAVTVPLERDIMCVEQVETDANGVVWVLYMLEGDYRNRRLARIDPVQQTAGISETDVWFAHDGTRYMSATESGLVFFASGEEEGQVIAFDYEGQGGEL